MVITIEADPGLPFVGAGDIIVDEWDAGATVAGAWNVNSWTGGGRLWNGGYLGEFNLGGTGKFYIGNYNWEGPDNYPYAGISLFSSNAPASTMAMLDETIDDGDLSQGRFRLTPNSRYTYIITE